MTNKDAYEQYLEQQYLKSLKRERRMGADNPLKKTMAGASAAYTIALRNYRRFLADMPLGTEDGNRE